MHFAHLVRFSASLLARDFRAGELRVLAAALLVAVAAATSVAFFADRLKQTFSREAHQLLGGDLLLISEKPWPREVPGELARRGLRSATSVSFISMVRAGEAGQLARVKAVEAGYPLRGTLRIASALNRADAPTKETPNPGVVWLDERLMSALGTTVGERVQLGELTLAIGAVLTLEPERGAGFMNLAPRLLINAADLPATGLIQTGSRVSYRLYAAGDPAAVSGFERWIQPRLARGQSVETLENARPEVRVLLERAEQFLGLIAALAMVLAGIAIAFATRRFVERHLDGCAVMRCLGAAQRTLVLAYVLEFVLLGAVVFAGGCLVGWIAHQALVHWLGQLAAVALPAPTLVPALQGFLIGVVLLLGFAVPPLLQIRDVPALRVIRRESRPPRASALLTYATGMIAASVLLVWQAGDVKLGGWVIVSFSGAGLAFFAVSLLLVRAAGGLASRGGVVLRYGLASLSRRGSSSALQIASLALGLTAILLLTVTRADLIAAWRRASPPDAPNRFVFNIQPDQLAGVQEHFREHGIVPPEVYPMVRGRLVAVNGQAISGADYESERTRRLVEREFNLSWTEALPAHNQLVAGTWWGANPGAEFSVEQGIARRLGLALGDTLTYAVAGETLIGRITSVRKLQWDSMRVNFFVIASPELLSRYPASYATSLRVAPEHEAGLNELTRRFPSLTVVDVSAMLRQLQTILDQVIAAVQFVFLFALAAGLIVLYAALGATEDERRREAALLRALGARARQVRAAHRVEFLFMGLLAGALGSAAALAIGSVLAFEVFQLNLEPNYWLALLGPLVGACLVMLNARIGLRSVFSTPPSVALREAG